MENPLGWTETQKIIDNQLIEFLRVEEFSKEFQAQNIIQSLKENQLLLKSNSNQLLELILKCFEKHQQEQDYEICGSSLSAKIYNQLRDLKYIK